MKQIPNIEELKTEFTKWHTAETTFAYGIPDDQTIADWWLEKLHHQLQKARQDWLREEIVKLEGIPVPPYPHEGAHGDAISLAAQRGYQDALQTIIDRYQAELDEDVTSK